MTQIEDRNAEGIVLIIMSMAAFAAADTLVKVSAATMSPAQVLFYLVAGGLVMFILIALFQREPLNDRRAFTPVLLIRYVAEVVGMCGMVIALALVPLSTVGAITQAAPLLVAVGAVAFFGETVGWRRWTAIAIGFVGVLMVVQPSGEGFDQSILWAVVAMVGLSVRDLVTRLTPEGMASSSLAAYTMIASTPFAAAWVLWNGEPLIPHEANWLVILPMTTLGAFGYLMLIRSLRIAEVSTVTPFRYSRIIFLLALGVLLFDERPSPVMLTGAGLIILSGTYLILRGRKVEASKA
ncbi:MAG: DMT family transporter [Pseudomonadota bacterium]